MKKLLLLTFVLSTILSVFYTWHHTQARGFITLSLELSSATEVKRPILQIFYDTGKGFRENDSHKFSLDPRKKSEDFFYTILSSTIYGLRLDYLNGPGSILLKDMRFISSRGDEILSIIIPENSAVNQTSISRPETGIAILKSTPEANDPYVVIPFAEPFLSPEAQFDLSQLLFGMKIFCTLFIGIGLIFMLAGSWFCRS